MFLKSNKMKLVHKLKDIASFNFSPSKNLIVKKIDNSIFRDNIEFVFKGKSYSILSSNIICDIQNESVDIYDLDYNKLISIEKKGVISAGIFDDFKYYTILWKDPNKENFFSIFKDKKEIHRYPSFYIVILNEKYRMVSNSFTLSEVNIYLWEENQKVWSFVLPEGYSIFLKPQVVNSVLFFNSFKEVNRYNKVVGLNLETGKLLWELNYQIPYEKQLIAFLLNPSDNLCYGYGGGVYQIFNPVKGEMVFEKNMENLYKTGIDPEVNRNAIYENKLWFVSGRGEKVKFGAVNLTDGKLVFVKDYPLEFDEQFDTPVFHNGKLYLRGLHYKTLYVFE